jgi:ribonuclease HI
MSQGPANTINRAELAAIFTAICRILEVHDAGLIFTDSQVAIHLLGRALREPHTLDGHLHKGILMDIAQRLVQRANAGVVTSICKVKAHSGITGNEEADKAAKAAAQPDAEHDFHTPAHVPYEGHVCVAFHQPDEEGEGAAPLMVSSRGKALAARLHASTKTGYSKQGLHTTLTEGMYQGTEDDRALGKESNAFWRSASARVVRIALKHRLGQWWHRGMAFRRRAPYHGGQPPADDLCPVCRAGPDSSGHMLLHCAHRKLKAMAIKRHDEAVRRIHTALARHARDGSVYTILDACKAGQLEELGADAKRLPDWILPQLGEQDRAKLRPDILRILGLPPSPTAAQLAHAAANKGQYTVQIVEVGYCSDYNWRETVQKKMAQHDALIAALQAENWKVDATPHVIVLGAKGAVFLSGQEALCKLGLTAAKATELLAELSVWAVQMMYEMTLARRELEGSAHNSTGVG